MFYMTIIHHRTATHGDLNLDSLLVTAAERLPTVYPGYRIISRQNIYRIEIFSDPIFVLIFTNTPMSLHQRITSTIISNMDDPSDDEVTLDYD